MRLINMILETTVTGIFSNFKCDQSWKAHLLLASNDNEASEVHM